MSQKSFQNLKINYLILMLKDINHNQNCNYHTKKNQCLEKFNLH
jgi:hypothetical protein